MVILKPFPRVASSEKLPGISSIPKPRRGARFQRAVSPLLATCLFPSPLKRVECYVCVRRNRKRPQPRSGAGNIAWGAAEGGTLPNLKGPLAPRACRPTAARHTDRSNPPRQHAAVYSQARPGNVAPRLTRHHQRRPDKFLGAPPATESSPLGEELLLFIGQHTTGQLGEEGAGRDGIDGYIRRADIERGGFGSNR